MPCSVGFTAALTLLFLNQAQAQSWDERALTTRPPERAEHAVCTDPLTSGLLLFGGINSTGALGDTWTFDGCRWTQQTPATSPSPRGFSALATDTARGVGVLFAGNNFVADTWEWNGTNWNQIATAMTPPLRDKHALAYDPIQGVVVLFGGDGGFGSLNDTWLYDGINWMAFNSAVLPPARENYGLSFDATLGAIVLFGGHGRTGAGSYWLNDTWVLSFAANSWIQLNPTQSPPPREDHSMAYDNLRLRTVVSGGTAINGIGLTDEQWEFTGTTWSLLTPVSAPSPRRSHSLVYCPISGELVMHGGRTSLVSYAEDTWSVAGVLPFGFARPAIEDQGAQGCGSPLATPRISSDTCPRLGTNFDVDLQGFDPGFPLAVVSIGFASATPSCFSFAHVSAATVNVPLSGSSGQLSLPIPNVPSFAGTTFYTQAVGLDSNSQILLSNQVIAVAGF